MREKPRRASRNEAFGYRLRTRAEAKYGYGSQTRLALDVGKSVGQINGYMQGVVPDWQTLIALAQTLGVSIDYLLLGQRPRPRLRPTPSEIREELLAFLEDMPEFVLERILWQTKAVYELGKVGREAFPDYIRGVREDV